MSEGGSVSWIAATDSALRSAVDLVEGQRQLENLQEALGPLRELATDFHAISQAASVARALGWAGRSPNPQVRESLLQAAATLDNRAVTTAVRGLEKFRSESKADLNSFWRQHLSARLGNGADLLVLAETLKEVDGVAELSSQLESAIRELVRTEDKLPTTRSIELLNQAESVLQQLEESLQPEAVRRFLSAVARGGASVHLLSDDVLAWLSSHNATGSFRIVAGHPSEEVHD
jgi:hypothetical protein